MKAFPSSCSIQSRKADGKGGTSRLPLYQEEQGGPIQQTLGTELVPCPALSARQARNVRIFISAVLVETIQGEAGRECILGQPVDSLSSVPLLLTIKMQRSCLMPHPSRHLCADRICSIIWLGI